MKALDVGWCGGRRRRWTRTRKTREDETWLAWRRVSSHSCSSSHSLFLSYSYRTHSRYSARYSTLQFSQAGHLLLHGRATASEGDTTLFTTTQARTLYAILVDSDSHHEDSHSPHGPRCRPLVVHPGIRSGHCWHSSYSRAWRGRPLGAMVLDRRTVCVLGALLSVYNMLCYALPPAILLSCQVMLVMALAFVS